MTGQVVNWTHEEYDAAEGYVRSTQLKAIMHPQGPRRYYWLYVNPQPADDDTSAIQPKVTDTTIGTLFHELLLEGQQNWFVCNERYNTKKWAAAVEENGYRWAIKQHQEDLIWGMYEAVQRNKTAKSLIEDGGFSEQSFQFEHEETGIPAKSRVDLFAPNGSILDVKTTRFCTRLGFDRQIRDLRYDFSAAFYEKARNAVPEFRSMHAPFVHVVVTKEYPYSCYVWQLDPSYLRVGHRDVDIAFARLKGCLDRAESVDDPLEAWPDLLEQKQQESFSAPDWWLSEKGFHPDEF